MTGKSDAGDPIEPFVLDEQRALWSDISGNQINGLGVAARRQPSGTYWHPPRRDVGSFIAEAMSVTQSGTNVFPTDR